MIFKSYNPFENGEITKNTWRKLLEKSDHSFFTSWEWISTWITCLPADTNIRLIVGYVENEPVLAFFIGEQKQRRHGMIPTRTINLNATGNSYFDELTIEYNSILFDRTVPLDLHSVFQYLDTLSWDEFAFAGVLQDLIEAFQRIEPSRRQLFLTYDRTSNSHFVELQKIRDSGMDYFQLLSANKRSQIRRSIKQYEQDGKIQVRQAGDLNEALSMFKELADLHQHAWNTRGEAGSFSNDFFYNFHQELIRKCFDNQQVQLLHIFNDKESIGYLYNFIYQGHIYFYQSGLNYSGGNNYRPGLVSHFFAILYNAEKNMNTYDFLAGDADYKKSLATNSVPMYWVRSTRSRSRFIFETNFKKIKQLRKTLIEKRTR